MEKHHSVEGLVILLVYTEDRLKELAFTGVAKNDVFAYNFFTFALFVADFLNIFFMYQLILPNSYNHYELKIDWGKSARTQQTTPFLVELHFFYNIAICHQKFTPQRWKQSVTNMVAIHMHFFYGLHAKLRASGVLSMTPKTLVTSKWSMEKRCNRLISFWNKELFMVAKKSRFVKSV